MVSTKSFRWECSKPAVVLGAPSLSVEGEGQRLRKSIVTWCNGYELVGE